jgi:MoaA/NifB/PqqE/SkfB family radical SAM enzyme
MTEGLGCNYDRPVYIDKMSWVAPLQPLRRLLDPPVYVKVDWAITNRCDNHCPFCPRQQDEVIWQACRSCLRRDDSQENLSILDNPKSTIKQMVQLGLNGIHIRGGNPLLEWERLLTILSVLKDYPHLRLAISTPGTGRSPEDIVSLYQYKNLILNVVLIGFEPVPGHCRSNGTPDSARQFELLDALLASHCPFHISVLIPGGLSLDRPLASQFIYDRWKIKEPSFVEFYPPQNNGNQGEFRFSFARDGKKRLEQWRDPNDFFFRVEKNTCLFGGMELTAGGSIMPCPGLDQVCGNVINADLRSALKGSLLYDLWEMSKNKIHGCEQCVLRYGCSTCAAADFAGEHNPSLKRAYCPPCLQSSTSENSSFWDHDGFVYSLSIKKGLKSAKQRC